MASISMKMESVRDMEDFLLDKERYGKPNFTDLDKWAKRVKQNLIYYQTNYFIGFGVFLLLITYMRPGNVGVAYGTIGFMLAALNHLCYEKPELHRVKKERPLLCVTFTFLIAYFLNLIVVGHGQVFFTALVFPVAAVLIHASLRLRNIKNKLTNMREKLMLGNRTPMSVMLAFLDMEFEGFFDARRAESGFQSPVLPLPSIFLLLL